MQVNFQSISGEGILTFKEPFVFPLALFDSTAVFIQGENKDEPLAESNGSGKSNLLETLTFTLFGKLSKRVKYLEEVINLESEIAKGEVGFTVGGEHYRVVRTRNRAKITTLNIYRNGSDKPELPDADNSTKQTYLENLIGIDFTTYAHTIMFCQRFSAFPDLKAPQRAQVLSEISGANIYLQAAKLSKERADALASSMADVSKDKLRVQELIYEIKSVDYAIKIREFEQGKRNNLRRLGKEAAERKRYLIQYRKGVQKSIDECKEDIRAYEQRIKSLNKYLKENKEVLEKASRAERQVFVADNALRSLKQKLQAKTKEISRAEQTKAGICPYCSQNLTQETIADHINTLCMEENMIKRELRVAETFSNGEQREYLKLKEGVAEYNDRERKLNDLTVSLSNAKIKLKTFQSTKVEEEVEKAIKSKLYEIHMEKERNHTYGELQKQQQERLQVQLSYLEDFDRQHKMMEDEYAYFSWWAEHYPKLRVMLFDENVDRLEEIANTKLSHYSSQLDIEIKTERETQSGNVRDEINILIHTPQGTISYEAYGGGERQKLKMALSFALSELISEKSGKEYNLIAFDEPNDGLDRLGKDTNAQMFLNLADAGKTVLVIEHDDYFADYIPNTVTVVKENSRSTIQGIDNGN